MKALKISFLYYCIGLIFGIYNYAYIPLLWSGVLLAFCLLLLLLVLSFKSFVLFSLDKRIFYVHILLISAVFYLTGSFSMHIYKERREANNHFQIADKEQSARYEIVIDEALKSAYPDRKKYLGNVKRIDNQPAQGKILVHLSDAENTELTAGEIILCRANLTAFNPLRNPGQFDYKKYMYVQGVEGQIYVRDFEIAGSEKSAKYVILHFRQLLSDKLISSEFLTKDSASLLAALLLGNRMYIEEGVITAFKDLGVMHVLAISGLHIGIIYIFLAFAFRFLSPVLQTVVIVGLLWLFVFLSGFSPSVFRAVFMFSIVAVGRGLKRKGNLLDTVGLALFFSLVFCPVWIYDVGFQLSYCAVIGIVVGMPLFANKVSKNKAIAYAQGLIYVLLVAQISVLPVQIYYFHQFSLHFLLANIVVIPLITVLIVLGICFLLFSFVLVPIAEGIAFLLNFFTSCLMGWVNLLKQFDSLVVSDIHINVQQVFLLVLLLLVVRSYLLQKEMWKLIMIPVLLLVFQLDVFYVNKQAEQTDEFIIPYLYWEGVVVFQKRGNTLFAGAKDSLPASGFLKDYRQSSKVKYTVYGELRYFYKTQNDVLLVLTEEFNQYEIGECATKILISGNVQINYERLLNYHLPNQVIVHNRTPKWIRDKIFESCTNKNIPFYDMSKKGYFVLD